MKTVAINSQESSDNLVVLAEESFSGHVTTIEAEALKESKDWFIEVHQQNGIVTYFDNGNFIVGLRSKLIDRVFQKDDRLIVYSKDEQGVWGETEFTIGSFSRHHFKLNLLFKPIKEHALMGLKWGAIGGAVLKLLDTVVGLYAAEPTLALLFLAAIGVCIIPRIGTVGVVILSFIIMQTSSMNFFLVGLVSGVTGALLGCLPGMFIGGAIGVIRKQSFKHTIQSFDEKGYNFFTVVLTPLLVGTGLIVLYLMVLNPMFLKMLE